MDELKTIIITLITSSGIIGISTTALISRLKREEARHKATEKGVQALLRDRLIYQYEKYRDKGYAPIYAKENFENLWQQYHDLGANGVMDSIHDEFQQFRTRGDNNETS